MTSSLRINALGARCPRPIIDLAKATRAASAGDMLEIRADDPAFELDVEAWCRLTKNELVALERDEAAAPPIVTAWIRVS